ncbi:MAG: site-specific integrase [Aquificota bacterium]|nr:MAG: site-specific integrase [Aquificota bacterium]
MKKVKKFPGVYQYESKQRRYDGRPDTCFYIMYKDSSNKLHREKIGWRSEGITAAYASQIRAERIRNIRLGEEIPSPRKELTFDQLAQKYLEWAQANKRSWEKDEQRYRLHLADALGGLKLKEINPFLLEKLKLELFEKGLAPATVKHCLVVVRQILNKGKAWGLYKGENPVSKIKLPTLNNQRIRFLSYEEADALLKDVKKRSQRAYEMCLLSLHTGMRIGEITALRWRDIDLESQSIVIRDPKNRETRRAYMSEAVAEMFKRKEQGAPGDLVFKTKDGKLLNNSAPKAFLSAVKALGLNDGVSDPRDKVTFHTLRHTFASWLAIEGTPLLTIKELLGHKTLAMVQRYAHLSPGAKREAIKRIHERLSQAGESKVVPFGLEEEAARV